MSDDAFVPFSDGSPILVPCQKEEPPEPEVREPTQTPEQRALYESLTPEFRRKFRDMMMPRGTCRAWNPRKADFLMALYDVWVEHTGQELEEWT